MDGNRWLVVTLALLTALGLVQSVQIERSSNYGLTHVLYRASGHGLVDLARDGSAQMRDDHVFYLELRRYAGGGSVVVPHEPVTLLATSVRGLTGAEFLPRAYDPLIGQDVARRLRDEAALVGTARSRGDPVEAVGPSGPASVHVVLVDRQGAIYVATAGQLARHGIDLPASALDGLLGEGSVDG
jgi:hypothetical protein